MAAAGTPRRAEPLAIESVVDRVYAAIRERITAGEVPRGGRVHQEDLAAELGVSRTPVREALRRLAAEGLVEMRTNRGARVADVGPAEIRAAYEARLVLEPGAARLAASERPVEAIARMRRAVAAQRRAIPHVARSFEANREFHLALVQASANAYLQQFAERLWVARIGEVIYERQRETPQQMLLDADEHQRILDAVVSGDARRAETLTRRHLQDAMRRSQDLLSAGD
ncbi:MAG TPA: GntR family transcriptional regulator [Solirubrobacteraceae bacterium]|nr:GntR family transcriptional regulator [Solirubrobacteraceae bacterium]